ncbi:hypothetical protein ANRL2_02456 [Anaerolineae bacterium]|nr:hypothetical protein ANRL2_02456 [Anaerolineae bacterium]
MRKFFDEHRSLHYTEVAASGRLVKIAWSIFTAAQLSAAIGTGLKRLLYTAAAFSVYPAIGDFFALLFYPLVAAGALWLLVARFAPDERPRLASSDSRWS